MLHLNEPAAAVHVGEDVGAFVPRLADKPHRGEPTQWQQTQYGAFVRLPAGRSEISFLQECHSPSWMRT